ncbi:MAG: efflux RND transporter periplasmic adaptor subunit [Methylobacteriaceae bacterium]|jgi:macrolide-specific efflux system membrane fusion protein|nr:efflux RND transporter periplasmic adaptor subunit [Methylobacteriaceae bacterium]
MPRKKNKLFVFILTLLVLAGAGWWIYTRYFTEKEPELIVTRVKRGAIEETVLATGTLKPITLVAVGAQVSGRVESLKVHLGQKVRKGDPVAEIDSIKQRNDLAVAEANLAMSVADKAEREANLIKAELDFERQKTTFARNASSKADYDAAEVNVKATRAKVDYIDAQIKERERAVDTARVNLGYTSITAPIDGTVLAEVVQEGQTVNAVQSAPTIVILGDIDTMRVRAEISEADIVRVKPGQEVYFTILGDRVRRYTGVLSSIEPAPESIKSDSAVVSSSSSSSASQSAVYYIGVFDVPNPDGSLRTYMTAQISIILGKAENALIIPASVLETPNSDGRYTVEVQEKDKTVVKRAITVGLNNKVSAEVLSGLEEGERIVVGKESADTAQQAGGMRMRGMGPPR